MKLIKRMINLYDTFCIWLWIKYCFYLEDVRLKAEAWTYKMDDKLKER